jgi:hypothetical protein
MFLRLKDLKKLSEERKNNGVKKSDENDVAELKIVPPKCWMTSSRYLKHLEELYHIEGLTDCWLQMTSLKKRSRQARKLQKTVAVEHWTQRM